MARLPALDIDQLTDRQRAVVAAINAGPRGAADPSIGLRGPFSVWVRSPNVGMPAQQLGAAVRFDTSLSDQVREVAICVVGAYYRAKLVLNAFEVPLQAGLTDPFPDADPQTTV